MNKQMVKAQLDSGEGGYVEGAAWQTYVLNNAYFQYISLAEPNSKSNDKYKRYYSVF